MSRPWSLIAMLVLLSMSLAAQSGDYLDSGLNPAQPNEETWEDVVEDRDYTEATDVPEEIEKEEASPSSMPSFSYTGLGLWLAQWGLFILMPIILALIIYLIVREVGSRERNKLDKGITLRTQLDDIDDDLQAAGLEGMLERALSQGDYRAALRIRYLIALRELEEKGWVNYRKEKTNFNYIMELRGRDEQEDFKQMTYVFEYVWYGGGSIDSTSYARHEGLFAPFINRLKTLSDV